MDKLPLAIRRDLRDQWENPQAPTQKSIATLSELLGLPVRVECEAPMIWAELQRFFADKEAFVPSVVGVIKAWLDCLISRLEDDSYSEWTEKLLENINGSGRGQLDARVETIKGDRVKTSLGKRGPVFVIALPEVRPPYGNLPYTFTSCFQALFDEEGDHADRDDEWTNVASHQRAQHDRVDHDQLSTTLPKIDTLSRPERLFKTQVPYHLLVKVLHDSIVVQGSHQPSLELLEGYLKKYTKSMKGLSVQLPAVTIDLQDSNFGLGLLFDSLIIKRSEGSRSTTIQNPVLVLSLIEGILGYHIVPHSCSDSQWYFRREVKFSS